MTAVIWNGPSAMLTGLDKARRGMQVVLHLGAHLCATTSFQRYMRHNRRVLHNRGIGYWGPGRTGAGLFEGLLPQSGLHAPRIATRYTANKAARATARAVGRVQMNCASLDHRQTRQLIVSDAAMLGTMADNIARTSLYKSAGERLARLHAAFDGRVSGMVLSIRSLDHFWASALTRSVMRGAALPTTSRLDAMVTQPRSWRDVIQDLACAMPASRLLVSPFERMAGHSGRLLDFMVDAAFAAPSAKAGCWHNRSVGLDRVQHQLCERGAQGAEIANLRSAGDGRWMPFDAAQAATLREIYAEDLNWLRAGADGLALLIEENAVDRAGQLSGTAH